jgi:1,4-dihydroxy-2-naphthoyl-CoA hydrolase
MSVMPEGREALSPTGELHYRMHVAIVHFMRELTREDRRSQTTESGAPTLEAGSFEQASTFVAAAGLTVDVISASRVTGHIDLGPGHHTPWGIVHGGVYTTAIESAASIGASTAVAKLGMVAVGLTNTTHFLRSVKSGRVEVEAVALNQGRTQQLWRVDVSDGSGKLIAHGEVRLQNISAAGS